MVDEETIKYLGSASLIILLVIVEGLKYGVYSIIIVILALLTVAMLLILNFADYLVFPVITKLMKVKVVPYKDYYVPSSQDSMIKEVNGIYYATGYLTANVYNYVFQAEQVIEGEEAVLASAPDKWEKAVMNVKFPFKFNIITGATELQDYRDELEGKRGYQEYEYSKLMSQGDASTMALEETQRKIRVLQARIDRIGEGERPVSAIMYIESFAVGVSEKEATDSLTNQLNQLKTVFNVFDVSIQRIVGRELYYLHRMNYYVPEKQELNQMFSLQK
jgi:hypothetical protein